ncbi:MAG: hypothetical protein II306_08325 [Clostridia bacterium]|nr:hypothetical protein [Clostridia bacterium]MEE1023535.1 hypothetical protein [Acutalibacteraceae bacterium]
MSKNSELLKLLSNRLNVSENEIYERCGFEDAAPMSEAEIIIAVSKAFGISTDSLLGVPARSSGLMMSETQLVKAWRNADRQQKTKLEDMINNGRL